MLEWYDLISAVLNVAQTHWFQYKISNIWELSPVPKPKLVAWPDLASICYFPNFVTFHFYCHPISFACQNLNNYWLCYTKILAWQNFASNRQPSIFELLCCGAVNMCAKYFLSQLGGFLSAKKSLVMPIICIYEYLLEGQLTLNRNLQVLNGSLNCWP